MENESCMERYGDCFSSLIVSLLKERNLPPQFIMDIMDENCEDRQCKHHVFSTVISWGDNILNTHPIQVEQSWTKQCRNCMCLLMLIEGEAVSGPEIARAFGISKQGVHEVEKRALMKIRHKMGQDDVSTRTPRASQEPNRYKGGDASL